MAPARVPQNSNPADEVQKSLIDVLRALGASCYLVDPAGKIVFAPGPLDADLRARLSAAIVDRGGEAFDFEAFRVTPLYRADQRYWLAVEATGGIERRRAEDERSEMFSARLAALGEMASGIAHEINNPLTVILSRAHMIEQQLLRDEASPTTYLDGIKKISAHATRIAKIVRGLRNFGRDDRGLTMAPFDLKETAEECVSICAERFKNSGIRLYTHFPESNVPVTAHEAQISQILMNLLNNAFDALKEVTLPEVHVEVIGSEHTVTFRVWDNGAGIPLDLESKIMQPFFTTKPIGAGTGLGLSLSRSLARAHGGDLTLNRQVHPSCFEVNLPRNPAPTAELRKV